MARPIPPRAGRGEITPATRQARPDRAVGCRSAAAESLLAVSVANLADETRALVGSVAQGQEATVYVRFESGSAPFVLRVTGYSPNGNPLGDVPNLCQTVVRKA